MSKLLINEPPLQVLPSLAVAFGNLNMAVMLQQIHYWISDPRAPERDGRRWHYATYAKWREQFPWLAEVSIRKLMIKLEETKIVISTQPNEHKGDSTKWYTIDYEALENLGLQSIIPPIQSIVPSDKKDHPLRSKVSELVKEEETTKESTKENSSRVRVPASLNTFLEFQVDPPKQGPVCDVVEEMMKIGIEQGRATHLVQNRLLTDIKDAIEITNARAKSNPPAYFEQALARKWKLPRQTEQKGTPKESATSNTSVVETQKRIEAMKAQETIKESPAAIQACSERMKDMRKLLAEATIANRASIKSHQPEHRGAS